TTFGAVANGTSSDRVFDRALRELDLHRLVGGVEGVRQRDVNRRRSVSVRTAGLTATYRLVFGEVVVFKRQVVHASLAQGASERCQAQVGDPGRCFDVAGDHSVGRPGVEDAVLRDDYPDRPVGAGRRWNVWVGQDPYGEVAGGFCDRQGAVEVSRVGTGGTGEVEGHRISGDGGFDRQPDIV